MSRLMDYLEHNGRPYVVRTVVSAKNAGEPAKLARVLAQRRMLHRWTLQQFVPVGDGYVNQSSLAISTDSFKRACEEATAAWASPAELTTVTESDKVDRYVMLNPAGEVFCRIAEPVQGELPTVGSILTDHVADLAERITLDKGKHYRRYARWFSHSPDASAAAGPLASA